MICSSFLLFSRAEQMTPSSVLSLHPLASIALVRSASPQIFRCSYQQSSLFNTWFLRPALSGHVSTPQIVDWTAQYAKDENANVLPHAAAISTNEPTKIEGNHVKGRTTYLGAYNLSEIVLPHLSDKGLPMGIAASIGTGAAIFVMLLLTFWAKSTENEGSVSDLVKRGQLRFDRKADSSPLKYDDPFNNPMVKAGRKNLLVRMCGRIFKLTPVTLTEEKVAKHQNRRLQAYQWKRPVVFLNEGDSIPDGVDPEEVRWIPSNHPFATTANYIDEDLAQKNVYQTRGIPARIKAEHEALRRKVMEAAQNDTEIWSPSFDMNADAKESAASHKFSESSVQNRDSATEKVHGTMTKIEDRGNFSEIPNFSGSHLRSIDGSEQEHSSSHSQQGFEGD